MTHIWKQTITINKDLAKQLIEEQVNLKVSSISILGEGWDNIAYLINKEFVFRFPRREMGIDCIKNEIELTPYISTEVTFPFSYSQYIGSPTEKYPFPFAGYKMLNGTPLSDLNAKLINSPNFAKTLALWMKELHNVPLIAAYNSKIQGDQSWRYDTKSKLDKAKERISEYKAHFINAGFDIETLLKTLEKFYSLENCLIEKTSYVHGDLYSRHILIDDHENISGIIDWGDIHIGNPGTDLAIGYMVLSDRALKTFFDVYGKISDTTTKIALVRTLCHSIALLPYCYEKNEESLKQWTILALKRTMALC